MRGKFWACAVAVILSAVPAFGITTRSIGGGLTASEVAGLLTGSGAVISNVRITGSDVAIGSFAEGGAIGVDQGVILSTGDVADAVGANDSPETGKDLGTAGHPALDQIVAPFKTHDAAVLEFDVITESPTFTIRYVFASEEYREWVGSEFNDVFGFFINGSNIALTPGSADPVTVNSINHLQNQGLYRDNEGGTAAEYDGFTVPLVAIAVVEPGVLNHIRIAIADSSDGILDSAVMIAQGGISGAQIAPIPVPPVSSIAVAYGPPGTTVDIPLFFAFENSPPVMSASGVPGATVTFSPLFVGADGRHYVTMTVMVSPDTPPGSHVLTIRSAVGEAEAFATMIVVVDCNPPAVLGIGQPQTQIVPRGSPATLTVNPNGSGPFRYQWYQGYPGMTRNPVAGGTSQSLRVPAVNEMTPYWVRVTNACGSYDSLAAFTIPQ